jgi:hypothetical protein
MLSTLNALREQEFRAGRYNPVIAFPEFLEPHEVSPGAKHASTTLDALISAFTAFVEVAFRSKVDALTDFGIKPPKARTPMTAEQKAVATAKRNATRAARGTKGPKAKKAVHGNITAELVVTSVPPTTTEAPQAAPAPRPATAAPPGTGTTTQHS